jgi:hypothetical protein
MEKKISIQVMHSVIIQRSVETVWDFTQDFSKRTSWDSSLLECSLVSTEPERKAAIRARGGLTAVLVYKQYNKPIKTSLRMTEIHSSLVLDGGGSWTYEKYHGATRWTQSNSMTLKNSPLAVLLKPFLQWILPGKLFNP